MLKNTTHTTFVNTNEKMQEEELVYKIAFYKKKLGIFGNGR
jgi:hypothetical protein